MAIEQTILNYIIGATSIIIVVCLWIAFSVYRLKKFIRKTVEQENAQNTYQGY